MSLDSETLLPTMSTESLPSNHRSRSDALRAQLRRFLTSKYGHYFVITLVTIDVASIFASFLLSLHICEHSRDDTRRFEWAADSLGTLSLVISCLFLIELLCSIYAFGIRYFKSKFHCFDAATIIASFLVDILLHGPLEEAGSLLIALRLFRVFKIIEEGSTFSVDQAEEYEEKIQELERENERLRRRVVSLSAGVDSTYGT